MSDARAHKRYLTDAIVKTYRVREQMSPEYDWYMEVSGTFAPRLLDADLRRGQLVIERGLPVIRPRPEELYEMLCEMAERGIYHRDVHPGNLVTVGGMLKLIDWETAIRDYRGVPSYDLWGPQLSGIEVPVIHSELRSKRSPNGYSMFWMSDHPASIKNQWGVDVPTDLEGR